MASEINIVKVLAGVRRLAEGGDLGSAYKQGPQGNSVADYRQDYIDRYGVETKKGKLGSDEIPDTRDNRDPAVVGMEFLAQREHERTAQGNGHAE